MTIGNINQNQLSKLYFTSLADIKAASGSQNTFCVCEEQETIYRFETNGAALVPNDFGILTTGNGGNTRWIGISGKYAEPCCTSEIQVSPMGTRYSKIQDALDSITDNDATHRYVVSVAPGVYNENIIMKPYVDVSSIGGPMSTIIIAASATNPIVTGSGGNTLNGFTLKGTTNSAIVMATPSATMFISNIMVYDVGKGLENSAGAVVVSQFNAINVPATAIGNFVEVTGTGDALLKALGTAEGALITNEIYVSGVSTKCIIHGASLLATSSKCLTVSGSRNCNIIDADLRNTGVGLYMDNACLITASAIIVDSNTVVIHIQSNDAVSAMHGSGLELDREKLIGPIGYDAERLMFIDSNDSLMVSYLDTTIGRPVKGRVFTAGEGKEYTNGMVIITTDDTATINTEGGNFIDVTVEASSPTGSTFSFQGSGVNHTILIGTERGTVADMLKIEAIKVLQTTAAVEATRKSFIFEKWNGVAWEYAPIFSHETTELYRYANEVFIRANSNEIIMIRRSDAWTKKTIDGKELYWFRIRIAYDLTTAPVFQQIMLIHSFTRFNPKGHQVFNGLSRFKKSLAAGGNIFGESGGVGTGNYPVGSGGSPTGWDHFIPNSVMNGNGDAIYFQGPLPLGVCTTCPLIVRINYHVVTGGASTDGIGTISVLPVETAFNTVADPAGGIVPITRSLASTSTLTSISGTATLAALPLDTENKMIRIESTSVDISNFYEGDMLIVRFEFTDDGSGNKDIVVWSAEIIGVCWTHGEYPRA